MRDATESLRDRLLISNISIHASHAGRDGAIKRGVGSLVDFNPRVPCGTRLLNFLGVAPVAAFQSTRPMRDATLTMVTQFTASLNFNPRVPCGTRLKATYITL